MKMRRCLGPLALATILALAQPLSSAVAQQGCARCTGIEPCQFICTTGAGAEFLDDVVCPQFTGCTGSVSDPSATCGEGDFATCTLPLQACCVPGGCFNLTAISCIFSRGITTDGQMCPVAGDGGDCPPIPARAPAVSAPGMLGALAALLIVAAVAVARRRVRSS